MQTNYYFLRQLSQKLDQELVGLILSECFSQEKDEIIFGFCTEEKTWRRKKEIYLKVVLRSDFVCLSFPDDFRRASKNSVNLFENIINHSVIAVQQFLNERAFTIEFSNGLSLVFKLFGNRSNLLLFDGETVSAMFHHKLIADLQLTYSAFNRPMLQNIEEFVASNGDFRKIFPTFGKNIGLYLEQNLVQKTFVQQWQYIQETLQAIEKPTYYLTNIDFKPTLSLLPIGSIVQIFQNPVEAITAFYHTYTQTSTFEHEKSKWLRFLEKSLHKTTAHLTAVWNKYETRESGVQNSELANIIMANLHQIPAKTEQIELFDFYRNQPILVKLKSDISPQKNAENFYRKAKNEKLELDNLQETITFRQQDIAKIKQQLQQIQATETIKELRNLLKNNNLATAQGKVKNQPETIFNSLEFEGYQIFIGRNAKNNDLLTQKLARKDDLWLHARDVTGSHVIIRSQAGKTTPISVIERAAALAAWHSKRRTDSLCPVIVTPRKFVRKTRNLAEGEVIVEKEEVIMVCPTR